MKFRHLCEYHNCKRKAVRTLRTKKGIVLGRYCEEHYKKVIKDLKETIKFRIR